MTKMTGRDKLIAMTQNWADASNVVELFKDAAERRGYAWAVLQYGEEIVQDAQKKRAAEKVVLQLKANKDYDEIIEGLGEELSERIYVYGSSAMSNMEVVIRHNVYVELYATFKRWVNTTRAYGEE